MRDTVRYASTGNMRDHGGLPGYKGHDARDAGLFDSAYLVSPCVLPLQIMYDCCHNFLPQRLFLLPPVVDLIAAVRSTYVHVIYFVCADNFVLNLLSEVYPL